MRIRAITRHDDLPALFKDQPPHTLKARETLFRQDAEATEIYFLVSGRIRLVRHTESGHAVTLHVAQESGLFAEGALFADRYKCDAVADVKSAVIGIKKGELTRRLKANPPLAIEFLERVTHELHWARALVELRAIRSAEERVLHHLLLSLPPGAKEIEFRQTLMQVASELGLSHEVYYRALAKLARDGIIRREGRRIRLLD